MEIIKATETHLPEIFALYRELFAGSAELDPERFQAAEQNDSFIRNILAAGDADVLLACEGKKVLGLALILEDETPDYSCLVKRKTAVLMDLVVKRAFRGSGAGSRLMDAVKAWAKTHKAEYLQLNVLAQNQSAIAFYKRHGMENTITTMECKL